MYPCPGTRKAIYRCNFILDFPLVMCLIRQVSLLCFSAVTLSDSCDSMYCSPPGSPWRNIYMLYNFFQPPHILRKVKLPSPRDFPGKNTGVGCHCLLQIFPTTQGSNPHVLRWQVNSLPLSHQGSPSSLLLSP